MPRSFSDRSDEYLMQEHQEIGRSALGLCRALAKQVQALEAVLQDHADLSRDDVGADIGNRGELLTRAGEVLGGMGAHVGKLHDHLKGALGVELANLKRDSDDIVDGMLDQDEDRGGY
jgi:hypothetical protein